MKTKLQMATKDTSKTDVKISFVQTSDMEFNNPTDALNRGLELAKELENLGFEAEVGIVLCSEKGKAKP